MIFIIKIKNSKNFIYLTSTNYFFTLGKPKNWKTEKGAMKFLSTLPNSENLEVIKTNDFFWKT